MLMILYAWVGGQSVPASFLATVGPGLILIVLFSAVNLIYAAKNINLGIYEKNPPPP
jgi:TRAP-type C4-dicarboxylate transport system permease large subunit